MEGANLALAFAWCVLCGFFMSAGAGGGGILAGIGHISILGVTDPNLIKVANQILEFTSRLVSVPIYHRQKRLVWSLALSFGIGAPVGAAAGSWFSKTYLSDMAVYRPVFGLLVALVAARVLYEGWFKRQAKPAAPDGSHPRTVEFGWHRAVVRFGGRDLGFNPWAAAAGEGPPGCPFFDDHLHEKQRGAVRFRDAVLITRNSSTRWRVAALTSA